MAPGRFDTDVIIAGGGPAGAATAIACVQRGVRVHLFERALFSGNRPGETLHPGIEPLLRQLGFADRFQAAVGARHSGIWLSWGGRKQFQPYGADRDGPWHGFQVSRTAFDHLCSIMRMSKAWRCVSPARSIVCNRRRTPRFGC